MNDTSGEVPTSAEVAHEVVIGVGSEHGSPRHVTIASTQSVEGLLVGGRLHPLHRDMGCPVCMHTDRGLIERSIVDAFSYKSICARVNKESSPTGSRPVLSPAMLENHVRSLHMEFAGTAMRVAADDRLRQQGYDPAEVEGMVMVDGMALMRATITNASRRLANGEIQPSLSDAVMASQVIAQMEAAQHTTSPDDMEAIEEAFAVFWQGVVQITTSEQQGQLALWIQNHPRLAALRARAEKRDNPEDFTLTMEAGD